MLGRPSRPKDRMQRTKLEIPFGHAFDRREVSSPKQMPVKIARSTPRPSFGLRELLVASHISRLASRDAAKSLTFFLSTPGVAEATAGGFPAISAAPGQFLLKDLVLLAASLSLLLASVQGQWLNVQKS